MTLNQSVAVFAVLTLAWVCAKLAQRRTDKKLALITSKMIHSRSDPESQPTNGSDGCAEDRCEPASSRTNVVNFEGGKDAQTRRNTRHGSRDHGDEDSARAAFRRHAQACAEEAARCADRAEKAQDDAARFLEDARRYEKEAFEWLEEARKVGQG